MSPQLALFVICHAGAIASSAPIWSFYDLDPPYNDKSFAQVAKM